MTLEKLPPHDLAAEESVIAACLVDGALVDKVRPLVSPSEFFREKNGWIYEAILQLRSVGDADAINMVTVASQLASRNRLEQVGGMTYLSRLIADLPTVVGVEYYAQIVHKHAVARRVIELAAELTRDAWNTENDPVDVITGGMGKFTRMLADDNRIGWRSMQELVDEHWDLLQAWAGDPKAHASGVPTGFPILDRRLAGGGLQKGKMYLVGGSTSMGKSTFTRAVLRNIALRGVPVGLLSLEQTYDEVLEELAFSYADLNKQVHDISGDPLTESEQNRLNYALGRLSEAPFHVDDQPAITVDDARAKLAALKARYPELAVVGVDYAQLFEGKTGRESEETHFATVGRILRDTGKELGLTLLVASQLVKEAEDYRVNKDFRPLLKHFRGGGMLTSVAYGVLGLFRPDYLVEKRLIEPDPERIGSDGRYIPTNQLEVWVLKQQRGPGGMSLLKFDTSTRKIVDPNVPEREQLAMAQAPSYYSPFEEAV